MMNKKELSQYRKSSRDRDRRLNNHKEYTEAPRGSAKNNYNERHDNDNFYEGGMDMKFEGTKLSSSRSNRIRREIELHHTIEIPKKLYCGLFMK